ncbi:hypothetical protein B0T26DRAFT_1587 [Lasiosphaeria miniovina]|uniref:Protein kinase domain-containing protein n=1 Tax=Lasiosphaeria miniovina TaxID=1954250 RepID=A0AA40BEY6_9PEZI|nr:uncharacterized protein B0T26DRAFT_1587 [Lasiosphaeria miniovina]KAK0732970.1 hypothetical protein B0T26DRAFT_1587 [Lasiosphaeria miniovina]
MHDLKTLQEGGYREAGLTKLKLTCPLAAFPDEILELGDSLEHLDLSGTGLSSLPAAIGSALPRLKIAFFSNCKFAVFPKELAKCPNLEMVAFRSNGMEEIPEDALPPQLRWLILTDNRIASLPASIGRCARLQKCMLAGNQLRVLPAAMVHCTKLGLLRLSANRLEALPTWLFGLPELAFLSFAGNPCAAPTVNGATKTPFGLADIDWADLEVQHTLGQGASGVISQGVWKQQHFDEEVAIKLFHGALTSDGTPHDELAACIAAGAHESLISVLGRIYGHPDELRSPGADADADAAGFQGGIVMQLIPPYYTALGQPPSLSTCTRDCFPDDASIDAAGALSMLTGIAGAAAHLHARGIAHGDLYAHNILASREDAHALLGDFGAATIYGRGPAAAECGIEKLEVLAFAHLLEDMVRLIKDDDDDEAAPVAELRRGLQELHARCSAASVEARPTFDEVVEELETMMGWRGMMRIPNLN